MVLQLAIFLRDSRFTLPGVEAWTRWPANGDPFQVWGRGVVCSFAHPAAFVVILSLRQQTPAKPDTCKQF